MSEASVYEDEPLTTTACKALEESALRWRAEIKAVEEAVVIQSLRGSPSRSRKSRSVWAIPIGFESNRRRH
jgi:hypothetical protein